MVWQYEEFYPEYPYLSDWVGKEFKFGVEMSQNIVGTSTEDAIVGGKMREVEVIHSDGILKPSFYLMGNKGDRPYQLKLSIDGLSRRVISTVDEGRVGNYQALKLNVRSLRIGGFEDFKAMGSYAAERLPRIAQEIILPPMNFPNDVPEEIIGRVLKYKDQCLGVLNWESTQKEIAREFCLLYNIFLYAAKGEAGVGLIPRRGDDKFTSEQIKELTDLIAPLK